MPVPCGRPDLHLQSLSGNAGPVDVGHREDFGAARQGRRDNSDPVRFTVQFSGFDFLVLFLPSGDE
jgi:hypothetical protein